MYPQLICAASDWLQLDERCLIESLTDAESGHGSFTTLCHPPSGASLVIAANRSIHLTRVFAHPSAGDREVSFLDKPSLEMARQAAQRMIGSGYDHQP
jgi:hypothetical protein